MILLTHILIALTSVGLSAYLMFKPNHTALKISYGLIGLTLATGTVLIFQGANVLHTCLSGLIYTLVVAGANEVARRRMVAAEVTER